MSATAHEIDNLEPVAPSERDIELAAEGSRMLAVWLGNTDPDQVRLLIDGKELPLPVAALQLFKRLLDQMAAGNAVTLVPVRAELTTQEAADLLNVSRPYVVKLLEQGELPHRKVGVRRRIAINDLLAYKHRLDRERERTLAALVADAQELDMGY